MRRRAADAGKRLEADLRAWFMRVSDGARRQAKLAAQMALKDGQAGRGPVQVSNRAIRSALGVHPGEMAGWTRSIKKAQESGFPPPYDEIDVSSGVQVFLDSAGRRRGHRPDAR